MRRALVAALAVLGAGSALAEPLNAVLDTPVSPILPGNPPPPPKPGNPNGSDAATLQRGMEDFINFNCVGCHAPNGGGGMGPSLSDSQWLYGSAPAQVFLSIYQGRPKGMPAWGRTLPESTIWDLVAYVESLAEKPGPTFGRTLSRTPPSPDKQQTPAEFVTTTDPWSSTQEFGNGQKPKGP